MKRCCKDAFELAGWAVFVASACLFVAASVRSGDILSIAGSLLFLGACFLFLVPLMVRPAAEKRRVWRRPGQ